MARIKITNMEFYHNSYFAPVFQNVSLDIDTNWKLGLVGRNGRGKTTFLKLLHGELFPTKGVIQKNIKTDMFPFEIKNTKGTALNVVRNCIAPFDEWESKIKMLEEKIAIDNNENDIIEYSNLMEMYTVNNGFNIDNIIKKELFLMKIKEEILYRSYETLSEGEKCKLQILSLFLKNNNFLLIDEPTNHLDISGRKIIASYLKKKKGFVVVSHDREFLNNVVNHILSINKSNIYIEKGNFDSWSKNKELKDEHERRVRDNLIKDISAMEKVSRNQRVWSAIKENKKPLDRGNYKKAQSSSQMKKALIAEKRINNSINIKNQLLKNIELDNELTFNQDNLEIERYLQVNELSIIYGDKRVINSITFTLNKGDRFWIRGKNGSGKSTLMNALVSNKYVNTGSIWKNNDVIISYSQQKTNIDEDTIEEIIQNVDNKKMFIKLIKDFEIYEEYFNKPIIYFSEGEKKKIDIAKSLATKNNILIWDEPLNYLDIMSRLQIERAILECTPTIIFVEHDTKFGKNIATHIIELD